MEAAESLSVVSSLESETCDSRGVCRGPLHSSIPYQEGTRDEHQRDAVDYRQWCAGADAERDLGQALHGARVACETDHELSGRKPIQVAVGEASQLDKDRLPEIPRNALAHAD